MTVTQATRDVGRLSGTDRTPLARHGGDECQRVRTPLPLLDPLQASGVDRTSIIIRMNHELHDFLQQDLAEMQAEYVRIRKRTLEDPGTAGDEGEEVWACLLYTSPSPRD